MRMKMVVLKDVSKKYNLPLDDPFDLLFTHQKSTNDIRQEESPKSSKQTPRKESINEPETTSNGFKEGFKYDHGYSLSLTYLNEDGLMDTYLNGNMKYKSFIETINESEKPREDPSDYFNFGLDEERWIKLLNKHVLMHYERNLIQQQMNPEVNKPIQPTVGQPNFPTPMARPMMPGAAMPNYPLGMPYPYRYMPYPGMIYPYHPSNIPIPKEEAKK